MASMNLKNTRQRAERFRVLIIGNANAGKTTILEKVCHAMGHKPKFLDAEGNEIVSELKSSDERGEHDIEHQIVYPTAQGFIFHDSRGFEAGATGELVKVKEFINERAKMTLMKDQLHAIWYCLPTSSDRPLTEAEMSLFESDIGNVPVIAVFTKMDALDKKVFSEQLNKKIPPREARKNVPSLARAKFERDYLAPLKKVSHQPKNIVELREMNKPDKDCNELVIKTAEALDSQALELLIISAHRNDVEFSIKRVINEQIIPLAQAVLKGAMFSQKEQKSLLRGAMVLFPHSLPSFVREIDTMDKNAITAMRETTGLKGRGEQRGEEYLIIEDPGLDGLKDRLQQRRQQRWTVIDNQHLEKCFGILSYFIPSILSSTMPHCHVVIIGTVIIFTLVDSLFAQLSRQNSDNYLLQKFQLALEVYANSSSSKDFVVAVENAFSQSDSMLDADGDLFGIIMANPLIAEILSTN